MKEVLSQNGIEYAYIDICSGVLPLKRFLKIRDTSEAHAKARETHAAGIPTLVIDDVPYVVQGPDHARQILEENKIIH